MPKVLEQSGVVLQKPLDARTYLLRLNAAQIAEQVVPGQFVHIKLTMPGEALLRHPFGVAAVDKTQGTIDIIYRVAGEFTRALAKLTPCDRLSILGPLGRGFDLAAHGRTLLVGGGTGLAPLLFLVSRLGTEKTDVLMGARTKEELFWQKLFRPFVQHIFITTDDGSLGTHGTVMALLPSLLTQGYQRVYVCGPSPMMKAVANACEAQDVACQVSLERYMACGMGACLSCTCQGREKRLKVCTDGPVFWSKEVSEW
jgi:dihydroorotate dehydrogenase electron transfer subunit